MALVLWNTASSHFWYFVQLNVSLFVHPFAHWINLLIDLIFCLPVLLWMFLYSVFLVYYGSSYNVSLFYCGSSYIFSSCFTVNFFIFSFRVLFWIYPSYTWHHYSYRSWSIDYCWIYSVLLSFFSVCHTTPLPVLSLNSIMLVCHLWRNSEQPRSVGHPLNAHSQRSIWKHKVYFSITFVQRKHSFLFNSWFYFS